MGLILEMVSWARWQNGIIEAFWSVQDRAGSKPAALAVGLLLGPLWVRVGWQRGFRYGYPGGPSHEEHASGSMGRSYRLLMIGRFVGAAFRQAADTTC